MDQELVASLRKSLESKSTEELRANVEKTDQSPEQLEAMRQLLDERQRNSTRLIIALVSAIVIGGLAAGAAWWQLGPGAIVLIAGVVGALLGFAAWYIPGLISQV